MNRNKLVGGIAIILLIVNIGLISFLFINRPKHPRSDGPRNIIIERLHFDKNQIIKYDALINIHREKIRSKNREIEALKKLLYQQLLEKNNQHAIDSIIIGIGRIQSEIEDIHYRHFEDIHQLCKADQEEKFAELTEEIAKLFSKHGKHPPKK